MGGTRLEVKSRAMMDTITRGLCKGTRAFSAMKRLYVYLRRKVSKVADLLTNELLRSEGNGFGRSSQRKSAKPRLVSPEEDVKKLIISANSLDDIWQFLNKRLRSGSEPSFILFSVVDEVAELLRLRFLYPHREDKPFQGEFIPLCDKANHLIKTVCRADTTFSSQRHELGRELYPYLEGHETDRHNVFSIPLVAGNRTIAVITLGFDVLDSFSQAKLSYVYLLRDQLAQVVWNLILQERLQNQPQVDNLTGLITYSSFHQVFKKELRRAKFEGFKLSLLLVDINDLKAYNEQYSHQMGDRAIARLATIIKHQVRGIDTIARYGNDEVAIILPESDSSDAVVIANRIIQLVGEPHKTVKPFTVTIGVACYPDDSKDPETLTQIAENAVEFGKHQSGKTDASSVIRVSDLANASDHDRLEVFTAQIAKKYGDNSSDLFETLLKRIENDEFQESDNLKLETVASLAAAMDAKDKYTRGHSQAVANYAVALAHYVNLPPAEVEKVRLAAFFHDIGKIGIPESILNKPGPLTEAEWEIMRQHPVIGARQILQPVSALKDIVPLVEYHHEHWDGTGHPIGLKGENIPIGARIVAIVDAFHALTSNRPYREALPLDDAMVILQDGAGSRWDPELIAKFFEILRKARCQNTQTMQPVVEPTA